jgi:hypothetical protein
MVDRIVKGIFQGLEGGWITWNPVEILTLQLGSPINSGLVWLPGQQGSFRLDLADGSFEIPFDAYGTATPTFRWRVWSGSDAVDAPLPSATDTPVLDFIAALPNVASIDFTTLVTVGRDTTGYVNVTGRLADSAGYWLNGRLDISVPATIAYPGIDILYTDVVHSFEVKDGLIDIDLYPTESGKFPYRFQFFPLKSSGSFEYESTALIDFRAELPNSDTEFSELIANATSRVNDLSELHAIRIASAIFDEPTLVDSLLDNFKVIRQSSAPIDGGDGVLWLNTSDGLLWEWSQELTQWVSPPRRVEGFAIASSSQQVFVPFEPRAPYSQILLRRFTCRYSVVTTNDASNYWQIKAGIQTTAGTTYYTPTYSTGAIAVGQLLEQTYSPATMPAPVLSSSTLEYFVLDLAKTNSPGNATATIVVDYSYVYQ